MDCVYSFVLSFVVSLMQLVQHYRSGLITSGHTQMFISDRMAHHWNAHLNLAFPSNRLPLRLAALFVNEVGATRKGESVQHCYTQNSKVSTTFAAQDQGKMCIARQWHVLFVSFAQLLSSYWHYPAHIITKNTAACTCMCCQKPPWKMQTARPVCLKIIFISHVNVVFCCCLD